MEMELSFQQSLIPAVISSSRQWRCIWSGDPADKYKIKIDESSVLMLVVDVNEGVTEFDKVVANLVRKSKNKQILKS